MPSAQAILEIDLDNNSLKEEVQIPEKLIKEYQDLNDKIDQTIVKIKRKRNTRKPTLKK